MTESSAAAANGAAVQAASPGSGAAGGQGEDAAAVPAPRRGGEPGDGPEEEHGEGRAYVLGQGEGREADRAEVLEQVREQGQEKEQAIAQDRALGQDQGQNQGQGQPVVQDQDLGLDAPAGLTRGIWWAAALLPFLSVAGAVLCFAAGVLNTGGCQPEGSALCTGDGRWFTFVLPLFVAPLTAAVTAIGAVALHRHRSTWLAVGYFVVFVSLLIGLAAANSGTR